MPAHLKYVLGIVVCPTQLSVLGFSFDVFHNKAKRTQQGNLLLPVGPDMAILNKPDRLVAQRLRPLSRRLRLL